MIKRLNPDDNNDDTFTHETGKKKKKKSEVNDCTAISLSTVGYGIMVYILR